MSDRVMNIVVAGGGAIGGYLAEKLTAQGHEVSVIDISAGQLERFSEIPVRSVVTGSHVLTSVLVKAGVPAADIYIAATNQHEANILSAQKARRLGANKVVALLEKAEYFDDTIGIYRDWLGIDLVLNTRLLVAAEIAKMVRTRSALAVNALVEHGTEMIQFNVHSPTSHTGRPLRELSLPEQTLVIAVKRNGELLFPGGDDSIIAGDEVIALAGTDKVPFIERIFGRARVPGNRVMILGGGVVGSALARQISERPCNITLIDTDLDRCESLSRDLDRTTVILGDGTDVDLLKDEHVESVDVFVAATGVDEKNIIAATLARSMGAGRCIVKVGRAGYENVCGHIGLEMGRSPDQIVYRELVRALLPFGVLSETPIMDGAAEFIEIAAAAGSPVSGKIVAEADLPPGSVLCGLFDGGKFCIPDGSTEIRSGSRAIVFCSSAARPVIDFLFGAV